MTTTARAQAPATDEPDTRDERADQLIVGQTYGEYGDDPADYVTITRVKHKGDTVKVKGTLPDGSAAERTHDRDEVVALVIEDADECDNCGRSISEDGIDSDGSRRCDDGDPTRRYHAAEGRPLMATMKHPR